MTGVEVTFQIDMGSPGPVRTGSLAELYSSFFCWGRSYIPPLNVLNEKLATGVDRAYGHAFYLRWIPLQISPAQYLLFCQDLRRQRCLEIEAPPVIRTWNEWLLWMTSTGDPPPVVVPPSGEEGALRKRYRKALAAGDTSTAAALGAEIRQRFDPSFS